MVEGVRGAGGLTVLFLGGFFPFPFLVGRGLLEPRAFGELIGVGGRGIFL